MTFGTFRMDSHLSVSTTTSCSCTCNVQNWRGAAAPTPSIYTVLQWSDEALIQSLQQLHGTMYQRRRFWIFVILLTAVFMIATFIGGYFVGQAVISKARATQQSAWQEALCRWERRCPAGFDRNPLILLSLDGFAAHYLRRHLSPSLEHLANCGSYPPFMNPVFPSKTFSNHYSIVTGLYPASHGIVDNTMYDPLLNGTFRISSPIATNGTWWGGEPIWLTAKNQGLKTATFFWPGSDVAGLQADYYIKYNRSVPFADRVAQVLHWLDLPPKSRPDFITLYFEEPDSSGHKYGPDSEKTNDAIRNIDGIIDTLMQGLNSRDLIGCINVIVVSDHGMTSASCDRVVYLDEMVSGFNVSDFFFVQGPVGKLRPLYNHSDLGVRKLRDEFQCQNPHVWVYDSSDLPVRWHYSDNRRIDPLVFDMQTDWIIDANSKTGSKYCNGGNHGYDVAEEHMQAIFIGAGPAFKINFTTTPFSNVQVYNLIAELLLVEPSPNNGTKGLLDEMLRAPRLMKSNSVLHTSDELLCPAPASLPGNTSDCPIRPPMHNVGFQDSTKWVRDVPWGLPQETVMSQRMICTLYGANYVTGFSRRWKVPLWAIFTVPERIRTVTEVRWFSDPRLATTPSCFRYKTEDYLKDGIEQVSLVPPEFADNNDVLASNAVPMYRGFHSGVLKVLWTKVISWRQQFPSLNIIIGPVWNFASSPRIADNTGVPTHYFVIVSYSVDEQGQCSNCTAQHRDTLGFILPHLSSIPHCWDIDRYLSKHRSSVNVIEFKTGLKFFTALLHDESLHLRHKLIQASLLSSLILNEITMDQTVDKL